MWWVYIIETESGRFYTGVARDINRRFRQHQGEIKGGAKFFRSDRPSLLIYAEESASRSLAQQREAEIKSLPRAQKEQLIFGV